MRQDANADPSCDPLRPFCSTMSSRQCHAGDVAQKLLRMQKLGGNRTPMCLRLDLIYQKGTSGDHRVVCGHPLLSRNSPKPCPRRDKEVRSISCVQHTVCCRRIEMGLAKLKGLTFCSQRRALCSRLPNVYPIYHCETSNSKWVPFCVEIAREAGMPQF